MNYFSLSVAALIPALLLCWYIYLKDRMEKEPIGLLAILFVVGAVAYIPAIYSENALIGLFDKLFASKITYSLTGVATFSSDGVFAAHSAVCGFIGVALVEEGVKWLLLYFITRKNKNFDHLFDGVVYAVFLSLGFAAVENVRFAVMDGWDTFLLRSLTSVPGHMTFGVLMGFCYTMWHMYMIAKQCEKELAAEGSITVQKAYRSGPWLAISFVLPFFVHGCYSFLRFFTSDVMTIIFYVFIVVLYILCFVGVHFLSKADSEDDRVAYRLLHKKYPNLKQQADVPAEQ